ncbi:MAG: NAD-dependent deacylase [Filomicrobium sp.]
MSGYERIVILSGAGLSAESGLATFRDKDGIWNKYDYRDVATPEGFQRNPHLVYEFYNMRRKEGAKAQPNHAHAALAHLQKNHPGDVLIVTQNIDCLHEAAGSSELLHMHGDMQSMVCTHCDAHLPWTTDLSDELTCPECELSGGLRPNVVWFGEVPYHLPRIADALSKCDLFLSIGTSGNVYPAAGFVAAAIDAGAHTVELNLEPSFTASHFAECHHGHATEIVPAYVEHLLSGQPFERCQAA